jgi:CRP-like cAMP-binding protein
MALIGSAQSAAAQMPVLSEPRAGDAEVVDLVGRALPSATAATRALLVQSGRMKRIAPDGLIFRQGEPPPLTLMIRGFGSFRRTTIDGGQHIIGLCAPGAMFGYSAIGSVHSTVDAVALTRAHAVQWPGREMRALVAADPGLALDVIDRLAQFVNLATERLDGFVYQDTRSRVLRVLIDYGELFFRDPPVLSRGHLPSLVGTTREMTGRVLRGLESEGLIARVGRRGLVLRSAEGLERALAQPAAGRG